MVPMYFQSIDDWLSRFGTALDRWEETLSLIEQAYSILDIERLAELCQSSTSILQEISDCKRQRDAILGLAASDGHVAKSVKDLASYSRPRWPEQWTVRLQELELQINRIRRLNTSLCVSAYQSHGVVSELLHLLATGRSEYATYSPLESDAISGGRLINEAA